MSNKLTLHIEEEAIRIETIKDGIANVKMTNLEAIQEILTKDSHIETPLLPCGWGMQKYVSYNDREMYALSTPPHVRTVSYDLSDESLDKTKEFEVALPGFLWLFAVRKRPGSEKRLYRHGMVYALKNPVMSEKDQLYTFPFSNVDGQWMCWGSEEPELGGSKSITSLPDRFLSAQFNSDLDDSKFIPFDITVKDRTVQYFRTIHLFRYLSEDLKKAKEEGRTPEFKWDALKPSGLNVGEAIKRFIRDRIG